MFRPKQTGNTLPPITANDIKSALTKYATLKSIFKATSKCIAKLKNFSNKLNLKDTPISDNEMIELVGILAFTSGSKEKTTSALMPLKDKFNDEFWFAVSHYKDYDRWIEIEHLQEIYKSPKQAKKIVDAYNASHEYIEKQRATSLIQKDSKHDHSYTQFSQSVPLNGLHSIPDDTPNSEKDSLLRALK